MIDWLRKDRNTQWDDPRIEVAGRSLPIAIRRMKRAKRLTMRLAPDGSELRVTLPSWGRSLDAFAFAKARQDWIARQLAKVPETLAIAPGTTIGFRGDPLLIEWAAKAPRKPVLSGETLTLGGPQDRIEQRVQKWLEAQALDLCGQDLAFYCARAGEPVPQLRLSRAKRRWGSCAASRTGETCIRINWRLVMAPDQVRRSVVAHEVAHLKHFDHSPAFHAHLGNIFEGDLPRADAWLKAEGRGLYAGFA